MKNGKTRKVQRSSNKGCRKNKREKSKAEKKINTSEIEMDVIHPSLFALQQS
jgi:hypothetical protein